MARRDEPRDPDPDDWFAEPEPPPTRRRGRRPPPGEHGAERVSRRATGAEGWPGEAHAPVTLAERLAALSPRQRLALAATALLAVLLIGLAVGGVFSSGGGSPSASHKTTTTGTTTAPKTTTHVQQPSVQGPTKTLRLGDKGAQVRALQRALASLGFSVGKVDGQYGQATAQAVARFQKAHKLGQDGICGTQTLAALNAALRASG